MVKKFVLAAIAALALVIVPMAAANGIQTQAAVSTSTDGIIPNLVRGVQATVSVPNAVGDTTNGGVTWFYSNVRLQTPTELIQVGWFKSNGPLAIGIDDCMSAGNTYEGIEIEWQAIGGSKQCSLVATPGGYTWGQAIFMQIKYLGSSFGDPGVPGDFLVTYATNTLSRYDLGWNPQAVAVHGSVGSEWRVDAVGTPSAPALYKTSFVDLAYQPDEAAESDPFTVADNHTFTDADPTNYPFDHSFGSIVPGTNSGTIIYPVNAINTNLLIIDNFNRANEDPLSDGGKWTNSVCGGSGCLETGLTVLSNQAKSKVTTTASAFRNDVTMPATTETYATIAVKPGNGNGIRLYCRIQEAGTSGADGYFLYPLQGAGTDEVRIYEMLNHVATQIATVSYEFAAGDTFSFYCHGSTLEGWVLSGGNWSKLVTTTDSTYSTGGRTGFAIRGGTGRVDDFGAQ